MQGFTCAAAPAQTKSLEFVNKELRTWSLGSRL